MFASGSAWRDAVVHLRGNRMLVGEDTWAAGPGITSIDTEGWAEGRAAFVVGCLRDQLKERFHDTEIAKTLVGFPDDLGQWVNVA
jgi:hypothetical protein